MGAFVVDTHALIWYPENDPALPYQVRKIMDSEEMVLIIPTVVLAEIKHLFSRKRIRVSFDAVMDSVSEDYRIVIHPFDLAGVEEMDTELDLHDAMIVSTATVLAGGVYPDISVITKDSKIRESGLVSVVW